MTYQGDNRNHNENPWQQPNQPQDAGVTPPFSAHSSPYDPVPPAQVSSGRATTAAALGSGGLVLFLLSFCCGLFWLVGLGLSVTGLILGYQEKEATDRGERPSSDQTMAVIGMITGGFGLVLGAVGFIVYIILVGVSFL